MGQLARQRHHRRHRQRAHRRGHTEAAGSAATKVRVRLDGISI